MFLEDFGKLLNTVTIFCIFMNHHQTEEEHFLHKYHGRQCEITGIEGLVAVV
jgi:hypothetical protein